MNHTRIRISLYACIGAVVTCVLVGCAADEAPPSPDQQKGAAEEAMEQHVREARASTDTGDIHVQNRIDITCTSTTQGGCTTYCCSDGWCGTGCN